MDIPAEGDIPADTDILSEDRAKEKKRMLRGIIDDLADTISGGGLYQSYERKQGTYQIRSSSLKRIGENPDENDFELDFS